MVDIEPALRCRVADVVRVHGPRHVERHGAHLSTTQLWTLEGVSRCLNDVDGRPRRHRQLWPPDQRFQFVSRSWLHELWASPRCRMGRGFLFSARAMSKVFRGKMLADLRRPGAALQTMPSRVCRTCSTLAFRCGRGRT